MFRWYRVTGDPHLPPSARGLRRSKHFATSSRAHHPPVIATVSTAQARGMATIRRRSIWSCRLASPPLGSHGPRHHGAGAVFAGRFSPEKGAVEPIAIARRAGMSIDLYGDAYDDSYAEREMLCRGRPVRCDAFIPRCPGRGSGGSSPAPRRVLCPANWDEPFGLVAAEAQACATPVVAYRRGGLQDIVLDGVTGYLVAPGDIDAASRGARPRRRARPHRLPQTRGSAPRYRGGARRPRARLPRHPAPALATAHG